MACSEKTWASRTTRRHLILDDDAPVGAAAAFMRATSCSRSRSTNMARNTCMLGIAREIAALTARRSGPRPRRHPDGAPIATASASKSASPR
jgi:hypothetical protein